MFADTFVAERIGDLGAMKLSVAVHAPNFRHFLNGGLAPEPVSESPVAVWGSVDGTFPRKTMFCRSTQR